MNKVWEDVENLLSGGYCGELSKEFKNIGVWNRGFKCLVKPF
jgi:hypothetical protein